MKKIPLTQGKVALVDDADYEWLMQWKWHTQRRRNCFYAARNTTIGTSRRLGYMHKILLPGAPMVDHKDGDGVNNQRGNLRATNNAQNLRNRGRTKHNTSGFKGVISSRSVPNPWASKIMHRGISIHLGLHPTPELAARAYDAAALEYHGEFARLNFPQLQKMKKKHKIIPEPPADKAVAACRALVAAYRAGARNGGSVDWSDVDTAYTLAKAALRKPSKKKVK